MSTRRHWSPEEELLLEALYPESTIHRLCEVLGRTAPQVYRKANAMGLRKSARFMRDVHGAFIRKRSAELGTRFQPGMTPWNKGVKGSTGLHPNSRRTQFRKGRKPEESRNYRPIGSLRINKGVLERKVTDDTSIVPAQRWQPVARLVWEEANGLIPDDHLVVFKPGRATTELALITPDALELITRDELMRRNSFWNNYPPEVAQLHQLRGAITRKINRKRKEREEQSQ